ncbi:hypothetical protein BDV93DRAFT_507758 [Ceratobasidium sp. AG-I]|nr:hypothetical protein BDV93DRAFT_507758 [Ceratobasidium sp. AG-I]
MPACMLSTIELGCEIVGWLFVDELVKPWEREWLDKLKILTLGKVDFASAQRSRLSWQICAARRYIAPKKAKKQGKDDPIAHNADRITSLVPPSRLEHVNPGHAAKDPSTNGEQEEPDSSVICGRVSEGKGKGAGQDTDNEGGDSDEGYPEPHTG